MGKIANIPGHVEQYDCDDCKCKFCATSGEMGCTDCLNTGFGSPCIKHAELSGYHIPRCTICGYQDSDQKKLPEYYQKRIAPELTTSANCLNTVGIVGDIECCDICYISGAAVDFI